MTLKPLHLFFVFISVFNISFSDKADSLKTALTNTKEDTTKINLLNALGWELKYQNPDTSILLGKQALEIAIKKDYQKGIANSNSNLGAYYWLKGDYSLSLSHHLKALEIRRQLNNKKGIAASLGNIGVVYHNQGNYPKALKHYFEALVIDKELENKNVMANNLGNIGVVYKEQADAAKFRQNIVMSDSLYAKALKHYFEALEIAKELGIKNGIAICLGNIGNVYAQQADAAKSRQDIASCDSLYTKALRYYFESIVINKELGNKHGMAADLGNIGTVYHDQADAAKSRQDIAMSDSLYAKALKHYFEALVIAKELGDKGTMAINLGNIGSLYTQTGRFKEAEVYLDSALAICNTIGVLNITMQVEELFSHLYDTTARYQLAYHHYKKYSSAKDSLFNEEKSKEIGRLEQNHVFEMAEMERIQKELERSRQEAAAVGRRNKLQYSGIILGLAVIFIGIFLFARRFRKIKEEKNYEKYLKIIEATLFISFLIFFEFILVLIDPYLEKLTGGEPAFKLLTNAGLAVVIFLLHNLLEAKLKASVIKGESRETEDGSLPRKSGQAEQEENSGSKTLLLMVGFALISLFNNSFTDKTDSLKTALANAKEDTAKVKLLNELANQYFSSAPDSALTYLKQASYLSNKVGFDKGLAESFDGFAHYHWMKGNYPKALEYLLEKLKVYTKLGDKKGIATSLGNIGIVYHNQGNYPKALKHYFEALVIDKELGNKNGMAITIGNIGIVYKEQANAAKSRQDITNSDSLYTKALKHHFESLEINKELENKNGMTINLGNIGIVYMEQASTAKSRQDITGSDSLYAKALKHYFEALEIAKELGNKNRMATNLGNIGIVYHEQAEAAKSRQDIAGSDSLYAKALKYYFEALGIAKELGGKRTMVINLGNIGSLYTQTGRFKEAEVYLDSALVICNTIGILNITMQFEEAISHLYDTTARYQLAYQHYKKYSTAKDSLFNEEKSKEIGRLEQNHEFEMEELEREIMEKERSRQETAAVGRRNSLQYSSIFLALIFLFGLVFFLMRISLPEWMIELSTFVPFMILFEFVLVLLDPYIQNFTGGEPLYNLLINALCALIIYPIHSFFEKKLKTRIYKIKKEKEEKYAEEFRKEAEEYGNR